MDHPATSTLTNEDVPFGPTGLAIYQRTYSRVKPNGERETWPETVARVCEGNLSLVYGPRPEWSADVEAEYAELYAMMHDFKILPAGRHLWASGVKGRQYLFNCHVAGWGEALSKHFEFTFLRLMEGGGVGANYSSKYLAPFGAPRRELTVHVVCDPSHPDYEDMRQAGVLSDVYDSDWDGAFEVEDSREGWAAALVDLIDTYMTDDEVLHDNRVYDVSRVRGKGSRLKTFGGTASGPQPFAVMLHEVSRVMNGCHFGAGIGVAICLRPTEAMEIDHAIAECVVSGGNRRSARMAICHWDDPYIFDFLRCKRDGSKHWTTNISVEIDDRFIGGLTTHRGSAFGDYCEKIHRKVVEGMLTNGEPGYWNSSLSNVGEVNEVIATNPCGEIALEAWENCNLGHVNLDAFAPTEKHGRVDLQGLERAHALMTRFLIRATYGDVNDEGQAAKLAANRRIGVGHFGVQGFLAKQGIRYAIAPEHRKVRGDLRWMAGVVRKAARDYAFELRIPEPVKVTTVAPTGTIAKLPGVTEGIHPIYARFFERRVRFSLADPDQYEAVQRSWRQGLHVETCIYDQSGNTAVVVYPTKDKLVAEVEAMGYPAYYVQAADEISVDDMLAFQAMYQREYADNAVSFTVNVPEGLDVETTADTIARWLPQLKGTTVMVDGSRPQAPYTRITEAEYEAAVVKMIEDGTDEECASGSCPVR